MRGRKALLFVVTAVLFLLVVIAGIFPEQLWALSSFVHLSPQQLIGLLASYLMLCSALVLLSRLETTIPSLGRGLIMMAFVLGAVAVQWSLPIVHDEFGNAFQYREYARLVQTEFPDEAIDDLLSLKLEPSIGRKTILGTYSLISFFAGISHGQVFRIAGVLFGLIFLFGWMQFIRNLKLPLTLNLLMFTVGAFSPLIFVFHDHQEIYAPVYASVMLWIWVFTKYLDKRSTPMLIWLVIHALLNIKLHPLGVFNLIPLSISVFVNLGGFRQGSRLDWKWSMKWIQLPIWMVGAALYFLVFKDHNDPRYLEGVTDSERLFLPLISPPAPLDRYDLLSWNHILDFINVFMLWSLPCIMIFALVIVHRKRIDWNDQKLVLLGNTAILLVAFLFMVNPLLSMPMDMDLFMFPAIFVLTVSALLLGQVRPDFKRPTELVLFISGLLITVPMTLANASQQSLSARLEVLGKRIFKTYYLHSSRVLITAASLDSDRLSYLERKNRIIKELEPWALVGNDPKYANLYYDNAIYLKEVNGDNIGLGRMMDMAILYNPDLQTLDPEPENVSEGQLNFAVRLLREEKRYAESRNVLMKILAGNPSDLQAKVYLMEACFMLQEYDNAYMVSKELLDVGHPTELVALRRTLHCALVANYRDSALSHCKRYLELYPFDQTVSDVCIGLNNGISTIELKQLFNAGGS